MVAAVYRKPEVPGKGVGSAYTQRVERELIIPITLGWKDYQPSGHKQGGHLDKATIRALKGWIAENSVYGYVESDSAE